MLFDLKGSKDTAVVTFDLMKGKDSTFHFHSLNVDIASTGERLLYIGKEKDQLLTSHIKTT